MAKTNIKKKRLRNPLMLIIILFCLLILISLARVAHVYFSVEKFKQYWATQNTSQVPKDAITIVALGDSTVQGIGASNPSKSFVSQVADTLRSARKQPVTVVNYSVSGATAQDVLRTQVPSVIEHSEVDSILIAVGPNDLVRGVSQEQFLHNYEQILNNLSSEKVVIATIPPLVRSSVPLSKVEQWNRNIKQLADKKHARVADVFENINPRRYNPRIYSGDYFHPSDYGYKFWARAFKKPTEETLRKKNSP